MDEGTKDGLKEGRNKGETRKKDEGRKEERKEDEGRKERRKEGRKKDSAVPCRAMCVCVGGVVAEKEVSESRGRLSSGCIYVCVCM